MTEEEIRSAVESILRNQAQFRDAQGGIINDESVINLRIDQFFNLILSNANANLVDWYNGVQQSGAGNTPEENLELKVQQLVEIDNADQAIQGDTVLDVEGTQGPLGSFDDTIPVAWEQHLRKAGLVVAGSAGGFIWRDDESKSRVVDGVKEHLKAEGLDDLLAILVAPNSADDMEIVAEMIDDPDSYAGLTAGGVEAMFGTVFPDSVEGSYTIRSSNGKSIVVKQSEVDTAVSIFSAKEQDVTNAMRVGSAEGVPWELLMMVTKETFDETLDVGSRKTSLGNAAEDIKSNLLRYNDDELMAYVASVNPFLANKIFNAPNSLTTAEKKQKDALLTPFKSWVNNPTSEMQYDREVLAWVDNLADSDAAKPGLEALDPAQLDSELTSLYKTWFSTAPSDEDLANFQKHFTGQLEQYRDQQDKFNPLKKQSGSLLEKAPTSSLSARSFLQDTDLYKGTFGNMPSHLTEEEYASTYHNYASNVLGSNYALMNPEIAMAGMKAGDLDVVREEAYKTNAPKVQENRTKLNEAMRRLL